MQLFEQTVEKDIFFGLKQYKLTYDEKYKRAKEALELLGLDFERIKDKSPLALSGGEKRKIAVAGILVCKPKYLIFDEPIAGLDCNSIIWQNMQTEYLLWTAAKLYRTINRMKFLIKLNY